MDKLVVGQQIEIIIEGITSTGAGVGRYEGMAVFVDGVLPDEIVEARITNVQKKYAKAELVTLKKGSKKRSPIPCPVYEECGGCVFQHTSYETQLKLKQQIISDAMTRLGKLDIAVELPLGTFEAYHYRNRINYHIQNANGMLTMGFYARASHDLIPAAGCLLPIPIIREMAKTASGIFNKYTEQLRGLRDVVIRCNSAKDALLITLVSDEPLEIGEQVAKELMTAQPKLVSVWQCSGQQKYSIYGDNWQLLEGEEYLTDELLGIKLELSPATFTQVNHEQTEVLYELIKDFAELDGSQTVLDLFCGAGTISLFLADKAQEIIGVESYAPAVENAKRNAKLNDIYNCRFIAEEAEKALPYLMAKGIRADVVVLDPPRAGCDRDVIDALLTMKPKTIIYVSCDPATLARDLRILVDGGYQADQLVPVDMFPQTAHVECVVNLTYIQQVD